MRLMAVLVVILLLVSALGFAATSMAFGGSLVLGFGVLGVSGYYWWGTELDVQLPSIGPVDFGAPRVYGGPELTYVNVAGASGVSVGVSGQVMLPIESFQFKLFGMELQPALGARGSLDYWVLDAYETGYGGLETSVDPQIVFITKPENGGLRWWGYFWPVPLIVGFGAYN